MSFWSGVVQGVKDVDVLKEKEALAEERKSIRDEDRAYRSEETEYRRRMDEINLKRQAKLDEYTASAELRAQGTYERTQAEENAAVRTAARLAAGSGVTPTATGGSGGKGGGSIPDPEALADSSLKLNGWFDTSLSDDTTSQEDADYITSVSETLTDPADAHEYWSLIKQIESTTGTMPTASQIRETIRVTQVPGYAENKEKAAEYLATINNLDMTTPEGYSKSLELLADLKDVNLNSATIDANLTNFVDVNKRPELFKFQTETFEQGIKSALSDAELAELENAQGAAATIIMERHKRTYGQQVLSDLAERYPTEFREYKGNPALGKYVPQSPSLVPADGAAIPGAALVGSGPAQSAEEQRRKEALLENPDDPEVMAQALEVFGKEGVDRIMYGPAFTPSEGFATGEAEGGSYSISPDNLEYTGGRDRNAPDTGDVKAGFAMRTPYTGMSLKDSAAELARLNAAEVTDQDAIDNLIEYMNATWEPEDVSKAFEYIDNQGPLPTPPTSSKAGRNLDADNLIGFNPESGGYTPTQMGATELNLPKVLEALSPETRKVVEAELQTMPEEVARSEGYRPVQIGATELNLPKVLDGLSVEAMKLVESDLQDFSDRPTRSEGYRPTQTGATELNLPKILEALSPETRKIVEAELQVTAGDTNLGRMEQSRLDRVGMESDRLSTESKSMPDGYTPTQMGATELNSPKVRSALDAVVAPYVEAKGEPLSSDEELAIGIETIVNALTTGDMDQGDLDNLIVELQEKYTPERVKMALEMAMNQQ